jgi:hypothetical protein
MNTLFKTVIIMVFVGTLLQAAPARAGVRTFTQPDDTTFQGVLKGDSSFHWIESEGSLVLYNNEDKFYYNASIDSNGTIKLSSKREKNQVRSAVLKSDLANSNLKTRLEKLYKESRNRAHPQ